MRRSVKIQAFVEVRDLSGKVVARGKSKPNNLILDNFGTWLAGFIRAVGAGSTTVSLVDSAGATQSVALIGSTSQFNNTSLGSVGTKFQAGSGSTTPARADYAITTAFATEPEKSMFDTGTGSYAVGAISVSGSITAGGSGRINEVGLFMCLYAVGAPNKYFMLFHDLISPGVDFVAAQIITVSYSITL